MRIDIDGRTAPSMARDARGKRVRTEGMHGSTSMCCGSRMVGARRMVWSPRWKVIHRRHGREDLGGAVAAILGGVVGFVGGSQTWTRVRGWWEAWA